MVISSGIADGAPFMLASHELNLLYNDLQTRLCCYSVDALYLVNSLTVFSWLAR